MQHDMGKSGLLLASNQQEETFIRTQLANNVTARLFSMRCQEAQTQALLNQDYACLVSQQDASSLCFCVCDGVGSSYRGDFAAHYLASQLLAWLQEMTVIPSNLEQFSRTVHGLLDAWARDASVMLSKLAFPPDTPELVREVLEELRDGSGSETIFFCGRIDAGQFGTRHPAQAIFCWMGNITARLSLSAKRCIILGNQKDDKDRWSTAHGRRGRVTIRHEVLSTIEHLTIHTDGLDSVGEKLALATDEEWRAHAQRLLQLPKNDDMTALEFCWLREKKGHTL